jgi:hypothetical protein
MFQAIVAAGPFVTLCVAAVGVWAGLVCIADMVGTWIFKRGTK